MTTRRARQLLKLVSLLAATIVVGNCGNSAPNGPSADTSFLTGTWTGSLTIVRTGQPDVTGPTTWTFQPVAQTNRQQFRVTIQSLNSWLPITTTSTAVLTPSGDPPAQLGATGTYASPRGCNGDFVIVGDATRSTITGTFRGSDCDAGIGGGIRIGFDGSMQLTK